MPQRDGQETLRYIRQEGYSVDVIVVTAASDAAIIRSMLQNGAIDYIIKPFVFERVKQALDNYRMLRFRLGRDVTLSQTELDELLRLSRKQEQAGPGTGPGADPLPKGLQELTMKQVLLFLMNESQPRSAEEVAEGIGLARVTVRRYLEYLEKAGRIRLDIEYGGVGRPVNRYALLRGQ
jgi:two-component system response regulator DctR